MLRVKWRHKTSLPSSVTGTTKGTRVFTTFFRSLVVLISHSSARTHTITIFALWQICIRSEPLVNYKKFFRQPWVSIKIFHSSFKVELMYVLQLFLFSFLNRETHRCWRNFFLNASSIMSDFAISELNRWI